jgi:hypothetical protein
LAFVPPLLLLVLPLLELGTVVPELELAPLLLLLLLPQLPPPLQVQSGASPLAGDSASPRNPITVATHCSLSLVFGSIAAPRFFNCAPLELFNCPSRPLLEPPKPLELPPLLPLLELKKLLGAPLELLALERLGAGVDELLLEDEEEPGLRR